jgi:hypothetical protein
MSRANLRRPQTDRDDHIASATTPIDSGRVAEDIGVAALKLADRARDAGLSSIGFLLEMIALEAGAEAAARQWPDEGAES